jgi:putative heme transporter
VNATVAVLQSAEPRTSLPSFASRRTWHAIRVVGAVVLAAALLGYVFPRVIGTTATDVRSALRAVSARDAVALACLWSAGLFTHSFVLTGALPGLTRRRALTLNLTGSAVANTLPFGGAAGMSLNYVMIRAWGVEVAGFASFTLVSNAWGILLKLVMPTVAVAALLVSGVHVTHATGWTAGAGLVSTALFLSVAAAALVSRRVAERAAAVTTSIVAALARISGRTSDRVEVSETVLSCRDTIAAVIGRSWAQLSVGTLGYGALQAVLLWACLAAVGVHLPPAVVLAGYAVDRVMTLAVLTPGATGFAEAGTAAALIALGGSAAPVAAGVLLYRGFTFAIEIPVGGMWLAGWLFQRRRATRGLNH